MVATRTRTSAVQRLGMPLDSEDFFAVEPEQVVEESLSAIEKGPVHWIGGSEQTARAIEAWAVQRL